MTPGVSALDTALAVAKSGFKDWKLKLESKKKRIEKKMKIEIRRKKISIYFVTYYFHFESFQKKKLIS